MSSPFEQVGFNTTPQFQTVRNVQPPQINKAPMTQTAPISSGANTDQFVRESSTADVDAIKAEIKEELRKEMEAEQAAKQEAEAKQNKKGPIQKIKSFIGSFKKFNTTAAEYIKGTFKGIASGALFGSAAYGALTLFKKPTAAKALGIVGAIGALGINLWQASLKANENRAIIDHTWENNPIKR